MIFLPGFRKNNPSGLCGSFDDDYSAGSFPSVGPDPTDQLIQSNTVGPCPESQEKSVQCEVRILSEDQQRICLELR